MNAVAKRSWRAVVIVTTLVVAVALAGPSFAGAAPAKPKPAPVSEKAGARQGIVQSVSAKAIVLRQLDGSTVSVPVASSTRFFVDGKRASLRDVKAGFVASATWKAGRPAQVFKAFDLSGRHPVTVGIVKSVSSSVLVVTVAGGTTVSIQVNAKTRVFVDGKPAKLTAVKAGYTVVITANDSKGDRPAHELRFLRPG